MISKAGYIQGNTLRLAQQRRSEGHPYPNVVEISSELWHCISPDFLRDELTRSLQRLRLRTLDVFLLHNPEYFLYKCPVVYSLSVSLFFTSYFDIRTHLDQYRERSLSFIRELKKRSDT